MIQTHIELTTMLLVTVLRRYWWAISLMAPFLSCFATDSEDEIFVPTSFRKIGSMASSLSYGHMRIKINLTDLWEHHRAIKEVTTNTLVNLIVKTGSAQENEAFAPFIESLEKCFEPSDLMAEHTKTVFATVDPTIYNTGPTMRESVRGKRQVLAGVQAIGTLLNLGISLYNTYEISVLNNEVSHIKDGILHIIETVKEEAHAIDTLSETIIALNSTVVGLADEIVKSRTRADFMSAFIILYTRIQAKNEEFVRYCEGLLDLLNGRFSPYLVDKVKILSGFRDFRATVQGYGYHLLFDFPSSIFKQDISYTVDGSILTVLIHNPIVKQDALPLYEYLGLPIVTPSVPDSPLLFAESKKGHTILVIDPVTRKGSELPSTFLLGCKTARMASGLVYLCNDNLPIMSSNLQGECLSLLFSGKITQELLFKACKIVFSSQETFAQQVDMTRFMLYSKVPTKLTVFCAQPGSSGTTNVTLIHDSQLISIPPGCQGEFGDLLLYARDKAFTIEEDTILAPAPTPVTVSASLFPVHHMVNLYKSLKDVKVPEKIDVNSLDRWIKDDTWRNRASLMGTWAFAILSGFLTIVVGYIGWVVVTGYLRNRKERHREEELDAAQEMLARD